MKISNERRAKAHIMTEHDLVEKFVRALAAPNSPFGPLYVGSEFDFRSGMSDIIALSEPGELYVFEAKLDKWRKALEQAYRSTAFCDYAYIVLPEAKVHNAIRGLHEFQCRGVGICTVTDEAIVIVQSAVINETVLPWVRVRALEHLELSSYD